MGSGETLGEVKCGGCWDLAGRKGNPSLVPKRPGSCLTGDHHNILGFLI